MSTYLEIDSAALPPRAISKLASSTLLTLGKDILPQSYCSMEYVSRSSGELNRTVMSEDKEERTDTDGNPKSIVIQSGDI